MSIILNKKDTTFDQLINIFLTSSNAKGLSEKTIQSYSSHLHLIASFLGQNRPIIDIKNSDIEAMISDMRNRDLSSNSIQSYLRALSSFMTWCKENDYPYLVIKPYKGVESLKEPYTDEELSLLLKKPDMRKCSFEEYRNWVIINLLIDCGCRAATIRSIQNRDVDLLNQMIYYRHTKNRQAQVIPLSSVMTVILKEYTIIRKGSQEDSLFCTSYGAPLSENALKKAIAKYNKRRGVEKTSIHLFRHTFARKYLLNCNGDAFTLQRILGHSTLAMTQHYCKIYNADLLKKFDNNSPLSQFQKNTRIKIEKH